MNKLGLSSWLRLTDQALQRLSDLRLRDIPEAGDPELQALYEAGTNPREAARHILIMNDRDIKEPTCLNTQYRF